MRTLIHSVWMVFLLTGCKGHPVGSRIPRPNKATAAGIGAAVAGALTLANPSLAGRKPETAESRRPRARPVKNSVPVAVLDRLDKHNKRDPKPPCPPAAKPAGAGRDNKLPIVPKLKTGPANGVHVRRPCPPPAAAKNPKPTRDP